MSVVSVKIEIFTEIKQIKKEGYKNLPFFNDLRELIDHQM